MIISKCTFAEVWDKFDHNERAWIFNAVRAHTNYTKPSHMGLLPFVKISTILDALIAADISYGQLHEVNHPEQSPYLKFITTIFQLVRSPP